MGIDRINQSPVPQRLGNDSVYGFATSSAGTVTITSNTTLTGDAHYYNLTVNANVLLNTNGYRLFVKNSLVNNGAIGIGSLSGGVVGEPSAVSSGTISGTGSGSGSSITYSVGGSGGGGVGQNVATQLPQSYRNHIESLINGVVINQDGTNYQIRGGADGRQGSTGTTTPIYAPSTWPNIGGGAGSTGGYSPNAHTVNAPGGRGNTGYPGTKTGATTGPGGAGGSGGVGGGVVLVAARYISGTGKFISLGVSGGLGSNGTNGNPGANGPAATAYTTATQRGTSGVDLVDGHQAPAITHSNPDAHASHPHPSGTHHHPASHTPNHHSHSHTGRRYHSHSQNIDLGKGAYKGNHTGHHHGDTYGHNHHQWTDASWHPGHHANQNHSHHPETYHPATHGTAHEAKYDANIHHNSATHSTYTPYEGYQPYAYLHTPTHTAQRSSHSPAGTHPHPSGVHTYSHHVAPSHYLGGAGGSGGTGAPAVTGGTGKRGGAGGGGGIIIITDSTPSGVSYDTRSGLTADSDTYSASSGYTYIVLNS